MINKLSPPTRALDEEGNDQDRWRIVIIKVFGNNVNTAEGDDSVLELVEQSKFTFQL